MRMRSLGRPSSAFAVPASEVCDELGVDATAGLAEAEAARRLDLDGPNRLRHEPRPSRLALVARQFGNSMVLLLVGAAAISVAIGELLDAGVILAIVVANAVFGAIQEGRADQAAAAVRALLAPTARVLRDGHVRERPADEVVVGDVIALSAGDRVAADGRLVEATLLQLDESALTGESLPRGKRADPPDAVDAPPAERRTSVLAGSTVARGLGRFVVTATGAATEMGRIAGAAARDRSRTPLQVRLDHLAKLLIPIAAGICGTLALLAYLQGDTLAHSVLVGVSLAVAALPEGLPAVVTITLALSMRQMAEHGAIVRRLAAVETLGSTTVICSDKTGTLTENRLAVQRLLPAPGVGEEELLEAAVLASRPPEDADPLEVAIVAAADAHGIAVGERRVVSTRPFDSLRKQMSVVLTDDAGRTSARVKGAPEVLLGELANPRASAELERVATEWAEDGLRVLLVAGRDALAADEDPERELEPLGLVGLADTPRATARASVAEARDAGVRTIMITGDHPRTAASVAVATGVASGDGPVEVVTGPQLDALSPEALRETTRRVAVFARVVPEHKVRIVEALKRDGEIAAMTGDGVNDVPALKAAHIGVAMGRRGTDAAGEAADMVLTDDDYSTIVRAIRQGRAIHDNIVAFAHFLFAGNAGEVLAFALAVVLGLGAPLTVLQILLVNLLLDGLPAAALGVDPPERTVMARPPRPPAEGLLDRVRARIVVGGAAIGVAIFASFLIGSETSHVVGQTMAFTTLVVGRLLFVFTVRGDGPFWRAGVNGRLFGAVALSAAIAFGVLLVSDRRRGVRDRRPYRRAVGGRAGAGPAPADRAGAVEAAPPRPAAGPETAAGGSAHMSTAETPPIDPTEQADVLLRDLHTDVHGLSQREADRRLVRYGRNELVRRGGRRWPRQLAQQFTHPLALLLAAAAVLALVAGIAVLAAAIVAVILLNAALAFVQERQAEAAIEALKDYLPPHATVIRDGREQQVEAALLVPGDMLVLAEGGRVSADTRLLRGALELDMSALTGESLPVLASRGRRRHRPAAAGGARPRLHRHDVHGRRRARRGVRDRDAQPARQGWPRCQSTSATRRARCSGRCGRWRG